MKNLINRQSISLWYMAVLFLSVSLQSCISDVEGSTTEISTVSNMTAELTAPPNVPPPVGARKAAKLIVDMEVVEKEGEMTDGVKYIYWTFNGTVPGSWLRVQFG